MSPSVLSTPTVPGLPGDVPQTAAGSDPERPALDELLRAEEVWERRARPVDVPAYQPLSPEAVAVISGRLFLGLDVRVRIVVPRALPTIDASYYSFRRRWLESSVRERLDELAELTGDSARRVLVVVEQEQGWWRRRLDRWAWRRGLAAVRVARAVPLDRRRHALRSGEVASALVDPPLTRMAPGSGRAVGR